MASRKQGARAAKRATTTRGRADGRTPRAVVDDAVAIANAAGDAAAADADDDEPKTVHTATDVRQVARFVPRALGASGKMVANGHPTTVHRAPMRIGERNPKLSDRARPALRALREREDRFVRESAADPNTPSIPYHELTALRRAAFIEFVRGLDMPRAIRAAFDELRETYGERVAAFHNALPWPVAYFVTRHGENPECWPHEWTDADAVRLAYMLRGPEQFPTGLFVLGKSATPRAGATLHGLDDVDFTY